MGARLKLAQLKLGTAYDDFITMFDVNLQTAFETKRARFTLHQRQHLDAEGGLQLGIFIQLVEYGHGLRAVFEFDDETHTVTIRFVAQVVNILQATGTNQLDNTLD